MPKARPPLLVVFRLKEYAHLSLARWASLEALVDEQPAKSWIYLIEPKRVLAWDGRRWTRFPLTAESLQRNIPAARRAYLIARNAPKPLVEALKDDPSDRVRASVAGANIPEKLLAQFAKDKSILVRRSVAWNYWRTTDTERLLLNDADRVLVEGLSSTASDSDVLLTIVKKYAHDPVYRTACLHVSRNQNASDHTLILLSEHEFADVRWNVARRIWSENVLKRMAADPEFIVRLMVAENGSTPIEVVRYMSKNDPSRRVRKEAKISLWRRMDKSP